MGTVPDTTLRVIDLHDELITTVPQQHERDQQVQGLWHPALTRGRFPGLREGMPGLQGVNLVRPRAGALRTPR
jgi:hypothetical protein